MTSPQNELISFEYDCNFISSRQFTFKEKTYNQIKILAGEENLKLSYDGDIIALQSLKRLQKIRLLISITIYENELKGKILQIIS